MIIKNFQGTDSLPVPNPIIIAISPRHFRE